MCAGLPRRPQQKPVDIYCCFEAAELIALADGGAQPCRGWDRQASSATVARLRAGLSPVAARVLRYRDLTHRAVTAVTVCLSQELFTITTTAAAQNEPPIQLLTPPPALARDAALQQ
jgi:hypothetical protein